MILIELTCNQTGRKLLVNMSNVTHFEDLGKRTSIELIQSPPVYVDESLDAIKSLALAEEGRKNEC